MNCQFHLQESVEIGNGQTLRFGFNFVSKNMFHHLMNHKINLQHQYFLYKIVMVLVFHWDLRKTGIFVFTLY